MPIAFINETLLCARDPGVTLPDASAWIFMIGSIIAFVFLLIIIITFYKYPYTLR